MSEVKSDGVFNLTTPVTMIIPTLFEPKPFMRNGKAQGEPKYGCNLVFAPSHPDYEGMRAKAASVARARWPDKAFSDLKFPFLVGEKQADKRKAKGKDDGEILRGKIVINTKSKYQPRLAYVENGKIVDLETDTAKLAAKDKFYNGVEVLAQLNFVPYEKTQEDSKDGVTIYLNLVLSTVKGTRLKGGSTAADVFKGYVGSVSAEDPTGGEGLDDIIAM